MIFSSAKSQAADYVLEIEAQDVLTQITQDLRAASEIKITPRFNDIDTLTIKYHGTSMFYYENGKTRTNEAQIFDITDTRVYAVSDQYKLNAKRKNDGVYRNPITGGNFFGDTVIRKLQYSMLDKKVLRITLEMESQITRRRIKVSTAVYMPAYENNNE